MSDLANDLTSVAFKSLGICDELSAACEKIGWKVPTEIQKSAIPPALQGKDVIGLAKTGSGKTGAFLLPMIQEFMKIETKKERKKPFGVILVPTRELAVQIKQQLESFGGCCSARCVLLVGGVPKKLQVQELQMTPQIIIGTPGRITEHLDTTKCFSIKTVKYLVLDEAEEILNKKFETDVCNILRKMPARNMNLLFSATMNAQVKSLARTCCKDPVSIEVSNRFQTAEKLKEYMLLLPQTQKYMYLVWLLLDIECKNDKSVLIFCSKRTETMKISYLLHYFQYDARPLQGKLTQEIRNETINKFKAGTCNILVATDLAARGLDIEKVDFVINFDVPACLKEYVHRVGRTARAGKAGTAITMLTQYDVQQFLKIEKVLGYKMEPYVSPEKEVEILGDQTAIGLELAEKKMVKIAGDGTIMKKKRKRENSSMVHEKKYKGKRRKV